MILLANFAPQAIVVLGTSAAIWLNAILSLGVISLGNSMSNLHCVAPTNLTGVSLANSKFIKMVGS